MFRVQDNLSCLLTGTIGHIGVRLSRQWIRPHVILRLAFILFRFGLGSGLLLQGLFVSRLRGKKPFDGLNDLLRLIPPCGIQGLFTLLQSFDDCPGPLDTPSAYFLQGTVRVRYPVFSSLPADLESVPTVFLSASFLFCSSCKHRWFLFSLCAVCCCS